MEIQESDISKADVKSYEACRQSGRTNMWNIRNVEMLTGLERPKIVYIMAHYSELIKKYNISREIKMK